MQYPKISIVTPSFNDVTYLERTILSIVGQGYPNLEYIVIDGGSTDGSVDVIRKYEDRLSFWISERDGGMYAAIQKGFERCTGDILGWINSDDKHQPGSLFTLAQIFSDFPHIHWIQGTPTVIDEADRLFTFPHSYEIDKIFLYQKKHARTRKFIQQESTFWSRSLWMRSGGYISQQYRYAGDFELWIRFFQFERLYQINAILASFRLTRGAQASKEFYNEYLAESFDILEAYPLLKDEQRRIRLIEFIERVITWVNTRFARILNKLRVATTVRDNILFDGNSQKLIKW